MTLAPEQMIWLTRYVICALPVLALLNLTVRRDPVSLCFGFVLLLLCPLLLSVLAAVQMGSPDPYFLAVASTAGLLLVPAFLVPPLFHMKRFREAE